MRVTGHVTPGPASSAVTAAAARPAAPTVIYIAGSGRSGSTLVERVIGEMPGSVNVGELIDLFRRVAPGNERCGCGERFSSCPFWSKVGVRAFGGWHEALIAEVNHLQSRVARQRHLPRLLAPRLAGAPFAAAIGRYGDYYSRLYHAVTAESGAGMVVDASKWPVQALALRRAGLDVRVIHLVRDVRGVAHSHSKRDVARPHVVSPGGDQVMWHKDPAAAATRWAACQSEAELLRWCGVPVARMRYEDFVAEPEVSLHRALAALGVPAPPSHLAHIGAGHVTLSPSHGVSGNPSRFRSGQVPLRADEEWRRDMRRGHRVIVSALGLPYLLRYRRPARSRTGDSPS